MRPHELMGLQNRVINRLRAARTQLEDNQSIVLTQCGADKLTNLQLARMKQKGWRGVGMAYFPILKKTGAIRA